MSAQVSLPEELSKQLGNLFYAIAKADSSLSLEEYATLSDSLEKHWTPFGEDTVNLIKQQFNTAQNEDLNPDSCFTEFINFLNQNPEAFNLELKELIFKTGNNIAYAFAKINKSELNIMARLSIAFKHIGL
ncbi:hypothetical protein [uncultured Winogradskyella sp.]|uniref:hypothetical protein n=1 Tax=uncultured Winogradskyella sp. TaxID=395353 RepID=UPI003511B9B8